MPLLLHLAPLRVTAGGGAAPELDLRHWGQMAPHADRGADPARGKLIVGPYGCFLVGLGQLDMFRAYLQGAGTSAWSNPYQPPPFHLHTAGGEQRAGAGAGWGDGLPT